MSVQPTFRLNIRLYIPCGYDVIIICETEWMDLIYRLEVEIVVPKEFDNIKIYFIMIGGLGKNVIVEVEIKSLFIFFVIRNSILRI